MKIKLLKLIGLVIVILGIVEAVYIPAGNWALSSGYLSRFLSRNPERFRMEWVRGTTYIPGIIHLEGVKLRCQSTLAQAFMQADRCTLNIHLPALVVFRIRFSSIRADGLTLWVRQRRPAGGNRPLDRFEPPIPGLKQDSRPASSRRRTPSPWSVYFGGIEFMNLREIWLGPYRTTGDCRAEGAASYRFRGAFELKRSRFVIDGARIFLGEEIIASGLRLDLAGNVSSVVPWKHKDRSFWNYVTGRCQGRGDVRTLDFLNAAIDGHTPITFSGAGRTKADLAVKNGVLAPGSRFSFEGQELSASSAGFIFTGSGSLSGGTGGGTAFSMTARWKGVAVSSEGLPPMTLEGPGFTAMLTAPKLDLASADDDMTATLDLPESNVRNISALNALLPPKTPVTIIQDSTALLRGRFELRGGTVTGKALIDQSDLGLTLGDRSIRGNFYAELNLKEGNVKSRSFDLSDSLLGFRDAKLTDGRGKATGGPWSGEVRLSGADLRMKVPAEMKSVASLTMSDTRPVMAALASNNKTAYWLSRVLDIRNLKGTAGFSSSAGGIILRDVDLRAEELQILADLQMGSEGTDGIMFLRFKRFSACVLFEGTDRRWKLINAQEFYGSHRNLVK